MKPEEIYEKEVNVVSKSVLSGDTSRKEDISNHAISILKAFWEDNEIQEITIVSSNIGFIKTYSKVYKK